MITKEKRILNKHNKIQQKNFYLIKGKKKNKFRLKYSKYINIL